MNRKSIVGITAEYHPFHNGHLYQLNEAKQRAGADFAVVLLSGHFVQRGMPAAWDTQTRTEAALRCGADAVFEIPAPFSTASAREYASFSQSTRTQRPSHFFPPFWKQNRRNTGNLWPCI